VSYAKGRKILQKLFPSQVDYVVDKSVAFVQLRLTRIIHLNMMNNDDK
jgi:hypothetical protein